MHEFALVVVSNCMVAGAMAAGILLLSRRAQRPNVLHWLWLAVLVKLLTPPLWQFGLLQPVAQEPISAAVLQSVAPSGLNPIVTSQDLESTQLLFGLFVVWGLGSLTLLVLSGYRLRRFKTTLGPLVAGGDQLIQEVDRIAHLVGASRHPEVFFTGANISPVVWTSLRGPRLLLPRSLWFDLNESQRQSILAHELSHVARGDDRVRWIELLALVVYWWNPLVWLANHQLRIAEERSCDSRVAQRFPELLEDYASALLQTIRRLSPTQSDRLLPISGLGRGSMLERRLRMLFTLENQPPTPRLHKGILVAAVTLALVCGPMLIAKELPNPNELQAENGFEFSGDPITFSLRDADLREVLEVFSRLGSFELEIAEDVTGPVTIELQEIPWDEALYHLLQTNDLTYSIEEGRVRVSHGELLPILANLEALGELDGNPVYRAGVGGVDPPRFEKGPPLVLPEAAREQDANGTVVVDCLIDAEGRVRDARIVSSNADVLSEAALAVALEMTFDPATLEGLPVASRTHVPFKFSE